MERHRMLQETGANIFYNENTVSNQTGTQNIFGPVSYHTTHVQGNNPATYDQFLKQQEQTRIQQRRSRYHASLRFDEIEARYTTIKPAHLNTCRWLFEKPEYAAWRRDDRFCEHHGLLWIKGKPGSGKSTIMKLAFADSDKLRPDTTVVAFFFNARGGELEKSTLGMYRSLLFQLLCELPGLLEVFDAFQVGQDSMDSAKWDNATLVHLFGQAVQRLNDCRVACFVDALDECDEEQIRDMISVFERVLQSANSLGISFRICFSSRHYPHITVSYGMILILEEQSEHEHDLREYLKTELKIGSSETALQIKQELLRRASGVFLWVVLVTRILNKEFDRGQMRALTKRLGEIPDDLKSLFRDILINEGSPQPQLVLCLQWVLHARDPLRPEQLYFAIISGTEPELISSWDTKEVSREDMHRFILNCSRGLVEQTKGNFPTVQFIHESIRDYFLGRHGLCDPYLTPVFLSIADSHDQLKNCCATYYSKILSLRQSMLQSLPKAMTSQANQSCLIIRKQFPFLRYAVCNMFYHSEIAHQNGRHQDLFLENVVLSAWVVLYNMLHPNELNRFPPNISLLCVLADQCMSGLTRLVCMRNRSRRMEYICAKHGSPLRVALVRGDKPTVEALLMPNHLEPQDVVADGEIAHHSSDDVSKAASELLKRRPGDTGRAIFIQAAYDGHVFTIKCLVQGRCHGETCDKESALRAALAGGHEEMVKMLLDAGADITTQGITYRNALCAAASRGQNGIVQMLLGAGSSIELPTKYFGSALCAAATCGRDKTVRILIKAGADVKKRGLMYGNIHALYAASLGGHKKVVKILLDAGANVDAPCGIYGNALRAASAGNHDKVVQLLLQWTARTA